MRKLSLVILIVTLVYSCSSKKGAVQSESLITEQEYYLAFTEGTKYTMLANVTGDFSYFKRALQMYGVCTRSYPQKAAPYYQISTIYLNANDTENARKYGIKAVERNDTNKWYLLHLANIYQYEKKVDSLVILYEKIVDIDSKTEYKYNLALFYNIQGEYDKSELLVNEIKSELEGSKELFVIRHKNYAGKGDKELAINELENLVLTFPDNYEYYGLLAEYLSEINRASESQRVYKELLSRDSTNGLANLSYGDFYLKKFDRDSALYYYKRGFSADDIALDDKIGIIYNYMQEESFFGSDTVFIPSLLTVIADKYEDSRTYTLAAEYYINKKKYNEAVEQLKVAIDKGSDSYIVWEQYVMLCNFLGKHDEVKEVYEAAIQKFPDEINLYTFSAYSLFMLKEHEMVIGLEVAGSQIEVIEKDQKVQFLNVIADSYRALDQLDKGDSIYEEILKIDPNNLLIRNNYSYYLSIREKDLERAEELSKLTVVMEPNNSTYLDTYGWILFKMGKTEEALKHIELALKKGAYNNAEVLDHYGDIVYSLNRCKEALEAWNEALKYNEGMKSAIEEKIKDAEAKCND